MEESGKLGRDSLARNGGFASPLQQMCRESLRYSQSVRPDVGDRFKAFLIISSYRNEHENARNNRLERDIVKI